MFCKQKLGTKIQDRRTLLEFLFSGFSYLFLQKQKYKNNEVVLNTIKMATIFLGGKNGYSFKR